MDEYRVAGGYEEMGAQFAAQVADRGETLQSVSPETLDPSPAVREFTRECERAVANHAPRLLDELEGIADAAGVEPAGVKAIPLAVDADPGCSLVGVAGEHTAQGSALFARNHDFYPSFRRYSKRYRTDPADGLASVGCAHGFVGRSDGVNEAGLAVGFAGVPTDADEPGLMWVLAVRAVLDSCHTVAEAVDFLEDISHARNVNLLLADATGDVAVVEAGPHAVETRRPSGPLVAATNQFASPEMREYQSADRTPADCSRYRALEEWAADRHDGATGGDDGTTDRDGVVDLDDLRALVGDPDAGVCWPLDAAGDDPRSTIWSWAIDAGADRGYLARDSPADTAYEAVSVPGDAAD